MFKKSLFLLTTFVITFTQPLFSEESYRVVENRAHLPILTPSLSQRQTLKIQLDNGLEAYLISDPEATKSAAALTVKAGSWQDPEEYPGIAHFLEHMLFLGTEKYPIESDYDRFIKQHDGQSNAYTASDYTLYLFSINNSAFEEALDRFSYFFKKPLFNPSGVNRELQAIDQEFAKNFNNDDIREHYILKELANPQHPFHRFSAGNSSTLAKVSQDTLKKWYRDHYSANLMNLVVYSSLPIDELKALVVQDFKDIPNYDRSELHLSVPLLTNQYKHKVIYIEPLKDSRSMHLIWELPSVFAHMRDSEPEEIVCTILGDEGPTSLLNQLKQENLAENLGCKGYRLGNDHFIFSIYITLTEQGLKQRERVIERCFQAINQLKEQPIPAYIFNEMQKMSIIRYQYQPTENPFDYVMKLAEWLTQEPLETFPEQSAIIQRYDYSAVKQLLNELTPQKLSILILAKPERLGIKFDKKEPWMGVPYKEENLSTTILNQWSQAVPHSRIQIPLSNPFIPKDLKLNSISSENTTNQIPVPEMILDSQQGKMYYSKDQFFQIPKVFWSFEIKTPAIERSQPVKVVMADLFIKCLEEALNPYSYSATLADFNYTVQRAENGIELNLDGYSDKASLLFAEILKWLKNCRPTEQSFLVFKDSLSRQYQNFIEESALKQGLEFYQSLVYQNFTTQKQKAEAIQSVTYSDFLNYLEHLFDQSYVTALIYGNTDKQEAFNLWHQLENTLASRPYPLSQQPLTKIITLPPNRGPFLLDLAVKVAGNAVVLGIEESGFSFKTRAAQQILMQAISGPFYSDLRTKQQTGYIVYSKTEELERHLFNFFLVQSNTHDTRDLLARFELFIESFLQEMSKDDLNEKNFEIIRQSLLTTLRQPPQNLLEMGQLLKNLAFKYEGDFQWISKRIQGFEELDYEDFLEMAIQSLGRMNKRRLAVLVQGILPENKSFQYIKLFDAQELKKLSEYTSFDRKK